MTTHPNRPRPVADALVMTGRSMRHLVRNIDTMLIGVLLPVMLMLLMTTVFGGAMTMRREHYVDYVVPGIILLCAGYGASTTAMSVTQDMTQGMIRRFRTMNVLPSSVLTGHVVTSLLRNLGSTAIVIATALAIGFTPTASTLDWLAAIGLVALFVLALSWLSAAIGLVARTVEGAASFGFFLLFLPYLSSAFVPIDTLPGWLQPVAEHQPFTPIGDVLRGLLIGTPYDGTTAAIAWCVGILVFAGLAAAVLWRRQRD